MKSRVHYRQPNGQLSFMDVVAPKEDAAAVFTHTQGAGCRIERIEQVGVELAAKTRTPAAMYTLAPDDRLISDQERDASIAALKALRAELKQKPAPMSNPGKVKMSMEQRHRETRKK